MTATIHNLTTNPAADERIRQRAMHIAQRLMPEPSVTPAGAGYIVDLPTDTGVVVEVFEARTFVTISVHNTDSMRVCDLLCDILTGPKTC